MDRKIRDLIMSKLQGHSIGFFNGLDIPALAKEIDQLYQPQPDEEPLRQWVITRTGSSYLFDAHRGVLRDLIADTTIVKDREWEQKLEEAVAAKSIIYAQAGDRVCKELRAECQAKVEAIFAWGNELCDCFPGHPPGERRRCSKCWQGLGAKYGGGK